MDGLTLLRRAEDVGLAVHTDGERLVLRGPKRAEPIARLLIHHKPVVLAALRNPSWWRDLFEERAAHRQTDAGYTRSQAERLAFGEAVLEWHRRHGTRSDPNRCAGCGEEMPINYGLALCDGARVHFDGVRGVGCIIEYGQRWRGAAVISLRALGLKSPDGYTIL